AAAAEGSAAAREAAAEPTAEPAEAARAPAAATDVRVPAPPSEDRRNDPEEEEKQNREEKGDGQRRPLAFPVRPSGTLVLASRGRDRGGDPRGNSAGVVARPEARNHLLVEHAPRERVGHRSFQPVAHLEPRLPRPGEDEEDHPVLPLRLPRLPGLRARDRIFLERGPVRNRALRVNEKLVRRFLLEVGQAPLEAGSHVGRDHTGFVGHETRRRRRNRGPGRGAGKTEEERDEEEDFFEGKRDSAALSGYERPLASASSHSKKIRILLCLFVRTSRLAACPSPRPP